MRKLITAVVLAATATLGTVATAGPALAAGGYTVSCTSLGNGFAACSDSRGDMWLEKL